MGIKGKGGSAWTARQAWFDERSDSYVLHLENKITDTIAPLDQ